MRYIFKMSSKLTFCVLVLLQISKCALSEEPDRAILQGKLAQLGQFPYVVCLVSSTTIETVEETGWMCTGTILTELWVVTGAHCYRDYMDVGVSLANVTTTVKAGVIDRDSKAENAQERKAKHHYVLEVNKKKTISRLYNNDVALLKVEKKFKFNKFVGPITIAKRPLPEGKKITCTLVGFGRTDPDVPGNRKMYYTTGTLDGDKFSCRKRMQKKREANYMDWSEEHLCMDPVDYRSTPCHGDSGGPIVCDGLVAGASAGRVNMFGNDPHCGAQGNFHVYLFIGFFEDWLRQHIPELPRSKLVKVTGSKDRGTSGGGESMFHVVSIVPAVFFQCILLWV